MRDLSGKVALVTGAASGIGRGLVDAAAVASMTVVAADVDEEGLAEVDASLSERGIRHLVAKLDVRDRAAWAELLDRTQRELGPVQLLCNNAGVTATPMPLAELPAEAWDWVVGVNLTGTFNGAHAVVQRLRARQLAGHIVNTASVQGLFAAAGFTPYNASKFGIVGLSETLRMELAPHDIGVSVLCPGPTRGRIMANSAKLAPHLARSVGPPRVGFTIYQTPAEVAAKVFEAVRENRLYVISHPEYAPVLETRHAALMADLATPGSSGVENVLQVEADTMRMYRDLAATGKNRGAS